MGFPAGFLTLTNFSLAFTRITRGSNREYKAFYRHLFPSYRAALDENLRDLVIDIKTRSVSFAGSRLNLATIPSEASR